MDKPKTSEKKYVISLAQLKELTWNPEKDDRVRLFTEIIEHEHKPMGPVTMIFVGIGDIATQIGTIIYKGLIRLLDFIDKQTEPKPRNKKP